MFTELARIYGRDSAAWGNDRTHWNGQVVNKGLLGAFEMLVEQQVTGLAIGFIEAKIALARISTIKPFERPRPMLQFSGFANQFVTLLKGHSQKGSGGYETSEKDMVQVFAEPASIVADGKDIYLWSRVFNDSFAAGVPKSVRGAGVRFLRDAKYWQEVDMLRKSELENLDSSAAQWARFLGVAEDQTYVAQVIATKRKERADYCEGVLKSLSPEFQALFSEVEFTVDVFDAAFMSEASRELRGTLIVDFLRICDAAQGVAQGTAGDWHTPGQLSLDVNWTFSSMHRRFQKENPATANAVAFTRAQAREVIDLLFKTRNWGARFVTKPFLNALAQPLSELDQDVLDRIKASGLYRSIADVLLAPFDQVQVDQPTDEEIIARSSQDLAQLCVRSALRDIQICPGWVLKEDVVVLSQPSGRRRPHQHTLHEMRGRFFETSARIGEAVILGKATAAERATLREVETQCRKVLALMTPDRVERITVDERLKSRLGAEGYHAILRSLQSDSDATVWRSYLEDKDKQPETPTFEEMIKAEEAFLVQFTSLLDHLDAIAPFCAEGLDLQPGVGAQKPTRKWLAYADSWLTEERLALLLAQLQGYELPGPEVYGYYFDYEMKTYRDLEQSVLRYWVWVLSLRPLEQVGTVLEQLIVRGSEKIPGIGPRSKRLAFAAIWALENHGDSKGRAHLRAARQHVTYKSIGARLDRALGDN
ncbi:MAG: hypothetical protein JXR15_06835 [Shimia sp.]|uniref:hypothetical protein n=1 Tax=Shimia sp. TaxID=1954381 RepID=UPI003B8E2910